MKERFGDSRLAVQYHSCSWLFRVGFTAEDGDGMVTMVRSFVITRGEMTG